MEKESQLKKYDAIIVGFGKGGKILAAELSRQGLGVAMIERSDKMYGGTCINVGCIPTKDLIHFSKISEYRRPSSFSRQAEEYRRAIDAKNKLVALLRAKNFNNLDVKENVTIYTGEARFVSSHTMEVRIGDETLHLESDKIFIDTGAKTVFPDIPGLKESKRVYTSTTIMELTQLPEQLVVIGAGYIGLEFASMYAGFGSKVTVLESTSRLLPKEDSDVSAAIKEVMEKKGIAFHFNADIKLIEDKETETVVTYRNTSNEATVRVHAKAILVAAGRRPDTGRLNLTAAGIQTDDQGAILVDDQLRTSVSGIWAMGDVKGGPQFTYISQDDYRIIRDDLFGTGVRKVNDRQYVPFTMYIDPPFSRVGIGEDEALRQDLRVTVVKLPVSSIPRARTYGNTNGLLKAVVDADTKKILGCVLFVVNSTEVINLVTQAMRTGLDYTFLRDAIYTHPSISESFNELFSMIK